MGKRVSIFELVEGVTYNAYNGSHKFKKQYTMKNGVLHNSTGDVADGSEGDMIGCDWIPMNADVEFEPATDLPKGAQPASLLGAPVSVLFLREGIAYKATDKEGDEVFSRPVTRTGNRLSFVDSSMNAAEKVEVKELDLGLTYTPIALLTQVKAAGVKRKTIKSKVKTKHLVAKRKASKKSGSRSKRAS